MHGSMNIKNIQQCVLYISSAMYFYFLELYEGLVSCHFTPFALFPLNSLQAFLIYALSFTI